MLHIVNSAMTVRLHRRRVPALVALVTIFTIGCGGSDANPSAESTHAGTQVSQQAMPEVATSASAAEARTFYLTATASFGNAYRPAMQALQVPESMGGIRVLTPAFIRAARRLNLQVHAWTINETEAMRRILALGVDGIITDYPDRLVALLGRDDVHGSERAWRPSRSAPIPSELIRSGTVPSLCPPGSRSGMGIRGQSRISRVIGRAAVPGTADLPCDSHGAYASLGEESPIKHKCTRVDYRDALGNGVHRVDQNVFLLGHDGGRNTQEGR